MNKASKIIGVLTLLGGAYALSKLIRTGTHLSINVTSLNPPSVKNGALILSANVAIDNPTANTLNIKKPYLVAKLNGNEVGNSIPSDEHIDLKANDRTIIKGITLQIPFLNLGTMAVSLVTGKIPKMAIEILVSTVADGIAYTSKQQFQL